MPGRRPRFSEMLVDRRRRLGLSISQASQVLRLKEQVLVAFEEGDFDHIPKSGYAQGMLASYARYLGLDSRQVSEQFAADLADYLREIDEGGEGRRGSLHGGGQHGYPGLAPQRYSGARGLLPTSGGLAGDLGAFATTSQPRSHLRDGEARDLRGGAGSSSREPYSYGYQGERRYTTRNPSGGSRARAPRGSERTRSARTLTLGGDDARRRYPERDRVTARRVRSGEYVDDLRYDERARPFEAASTRSGRRSSQNIANTRRPNVQRRGSSGSRGRQAPRRGGLAGVVDGFFADPRRALLVVVIVAALLLTVILVSSVRSCIANQNSTGRTVEVTQSDTTPKGDDAAEDTSAADAAALADAAAAKKPEQAPTETVVEVSVANGMVSWVEIVCDGKSVEADTIVGPWESSFTVKDSITVEVGDTSAVTVTENGVRRRFESRTAGLGSITIQSATKALGATQGGQAESSSDADSAGSTEDGGETSEDGYTSDGEQPDGYDYESEE